MSNKSLYIAVDFDGTVVKHKYPEVGEDINAQKTLRRLVDAGHKLILFTMRHDDKLDEAIKWYEDNDIELFGVNENPTQHTWTDSPKVYANIYIDDCALGVPLMQDLEGNKFVDWRRVEALLEATGVIPTYMTKDQIRREKELKQKNND